MLPMQGAQVRSLVGELRSARHAARQKKKRGFTNIEKDSKMDRAKVQTSHVVSDSAAPLMHQASRRCPSAPTQLQKQQGRMRLP